MTEKVVLWGQIDPTQQVFFRRFYFFEFRA